MRLRTQAQQLLEDGADKNKVFEHGGFGDVPGGAERECARFVRGSAGRTENYNRNGTTATAGPDALQHIVARPFRQIEIKNHKIRTRAHGSIQLIEMAYGRFAVSEDEQMALNSMLSETFTDQ